MTATRTDSPQAEKHMKTTLVRRGELVVGKSRTQVLEARYLGSCLGLAVFDPQVGVGGLVHCMLPLAEVDPDKARDKPGMFVDTGVEALLQEILAQGGQHPNLVAKMAGGASPRGSEGALGIGSRNEQVMRRILEENNISIAREDVGGTRSRSLYLYLKDGRTMVKYEGKEVEL